MREARNVSQSVKSHRPDTWAINNNEEIYAKSKRDGFAKTGNFHGDGYARDQHRELPNSGRPDEAP